MTDPGQTAELPPVDVDAGGSTAPPSRVDSPWRVLRTWPALLIFALAVVALLADHIGTRDPLEQSLRASFSPPAWMTDGMADHPLGTDSLGRDILSRVVHSARVSLSVAALGVGLGATLGTTFGMVAGYAGGWLDALMMRVVDAALAFPVIVLALLLAVIFGPNFGVVVSIIAVFVGVQVARLVRGRTANIMESEFVALAQIAGAPARRIMARHILPNLVDTVVVMATWLIGQAIIIEGSLSFLSVGVPPPTPSWGSMISEGRGHLESAWWISLFPGLAMTAVVLAFNALGDRLRDAMDPHLRTL